VPLIQQQVSCYMRRCPNQSKAHMHFQWGLGGIVMTSIMGLVWGVAFLLRGRNPWIVIMAHSTAHIALVLQLYSSPAPAQSPNSEGGMGATRRQWRLRRCFTRTGWNGAFGTSRFARLSRNYVALGSKAHTLSQKRKAP